MPNISAADVMSSPLDESSPFLTARTSQGSEVRVKIITVAVPSRKRQRRPSTAAAEQQQSQPPSHQASATIKRPPCNCKRNNCLKLYCMCFQFGVYCYEASCVCVDCRNVKGHPQRRELILKHLGRNPDTFRRPAINAAEVEQPASSAVEVASAPPDDRIRQAWRLETQQLGHLFHTLRQAGERDNTTITTKPPKGVPSKKLYRKLKTHMGQLVQCMEAAEKRFSNDSGHVTPASSGALNLPAPFAPTKDNSLMPSESGWLPDSVLSSIEINVGPSPTESLPWSNNNLAVGGNGGLGANEKELIKLDAERELNILASQDVALLKKLTEIIKQKTRNLTRQRQQKPSQQM